MSKRKPGALAAEQPARRRKRQRRARRLGRDARDETDRARRRAFARAPRATRPACPRATARDDGSRSRVAFVAQRVEQLETRFERFDEVLRVAARSGNSAAPARPREARPRRRVVPGVGIRQDRSEARRTGSAFSPRLRCTLRPIQNSWNQATCPNVQSGGSTSASMRRLVDQAKGLSAERALEDRGPGQQAIARIDEGEREQVFSGRAQLRYRESSSWPRPAPIARGRDFDRSEAGARSIGS